MSALSSQRKVFSEALFGIVVLLLVAYQVLYQLPHSPHHRMKLAGIALQAALGLFVLASAAWMRRHQKARESSGHAGEAA